MAPAVRSHHNSPEAILDFVGRDGSISNLAAYNCDRNAYTHETNSSKHGMVVERLQRPVFCASCLLCVHRSNAMTNTYQGIL